MFEAYFQCDSNQASRQSRKFRLCKNVTVYHCSHSSLFKSFEKSARTGRKKPRETLQDAPDIYTWTYNMLSIILSSIQYIISRVCPDYEENVDSPPYQDDLTDLDLLRPETRFPHKKENSLDLQSLPEELLLHIMKYLGPADLFLLRRATGLFYRLSCDGSFCLLRTTAIQRPDRFEWDFFFQVPKSIVARNLLRKDLFCSQCLDARKDQSFVVRKGNEMFHSSLFCHGCLEAHPRGLFSAKQRSSPRRICIGREGYISLCSHKTLTWTEFEEFQNAWRSGSQTCIKCDHCPHPYSQSSRGHVGVVNLWGSPYITTKVPVFKIDPRRELTIDDMKRICKFSRNLSAANSTFCPHIRLDDNKLLTAFKPPGCVCLQSNMNREQIQLRARECGEIDSFCLDKANEDPSRAGHLLLDTDSHELRCDQCRAFYSWSRDGSSVFVSRQNYFLAKQTPTSKYWLQALNPMSWSVIDDEETKHSWWCSDTNCFTTRNWIMLSRGLTQLSCNSDCIEI